MAEDKNKQNLLKEIDKKVRPLSDDIKGLTERQSDQAKKMAQVHAESTDAGIAIKEIREDVDAINVNVTSIVELQKSQAEKLNDTIGEQIKDAIGKSVEKGKLTQQDIIHKCEAIEAEIAPEFRNSNQAQAIAIRVAVLNDLSDLLFPSSKRKS